MRRPRSSVPLRDCSDLHGYGRGAVSAKTRVIDCVMAAYELDAIDVRLAELEDVVTAHHAVQGSLTFRGDPHTPIKLPEKMISKIVELPDQFVFPDGRDIPVEHVPWLREKFLREVSLEAAVPIDPEAFFMVSDGDEIPHPDAIRQAVEEYDTKGPRLLVTDHRQWYADWRAPDTQQYPHPVGRYPVIGKYDDFNRGDGADNSRCLAPLSANHPWPRCDATGWHLSSLSDAAFMHDKLGKYSHWELDNPRERDMERLEKCRRERKDMLGRYDLEVTNDLPATIRQFPHLLGAESALIEHALA